MSRNKDTKGILALYNGAKSHKTPRRVQDLLTAMALIRFNRNAYDDDELEDLAEMEVDVRENWDFRSKLVGELADVLEKPVAAKHLEKLSKEQLQAIATMVQEKCAIEEWGFMKLRPPKPTEKSKGTGKGNGNDYSEVDDGLGFSMFPGPDVRPIAVRVRTALSKMSATAPEASDPDHDIAAAARRAYHNTSIADKRNAQKIDVLLSISRASMPIEVLLGLEPAPKRARR